MKTEGTSLLEFFRGWKRQLGCVTLVMACLLAIGWVRSLIVMDYIDLPVGQHTFFVLATHPQFVAMFAEFDPIVESSPFAATWQCQATAKLTQEDLEETNFDAIYSIIRYRNHPPMVTGPGQPLKVPTLSAYHCLVGLPVMYVLATPLTLLSAWLLLSNPRTKPEAPVALASENA